MRAQIASAAGKQHTTSLVMDLEMSMKRVWKLTLAGQISWKERRGPGSSVRLRYDTIVSPDNKIHEPQRDVPDDV